MRADELDDLKTMMQTMQQNMTVMQERIERLEQEKAQQTIQNEARIEALQTQLTGISGQPSTQPKGLAGMMKNFNPDISVMGDFVYMASDLDGAEGDNDFNMREVELAFSANVDTYARADFFVAIENEDGATEVALEEGYLTLLETPVDGLQGKFGKFRSNFGKANRYHLHNMPWVDYPKVIQTYFGEEGFSEAGVSVNYLIPNPWDIYSEVTLEAVNNSTTVLGGGSEAESIYLAHLKEFFELNKTLTMELGGSQLFGENDNTDGNETRISGADVTFKWQSNEPGSYKKLTWQTEALFNTKEAADDNFDTWGMYTSLDHQFTERWSAFTRYDFSNDPLDSALETRGYSTGLTFAQSEYAFWRLQFTHNDNTDTEDENVVWLQLDFGIGPHRAHVY